MSFQCIEVSRDAGVGTITLHRPDELNAYTTQMGLELFTQMAAFDDDEAIRAIIITGAGRHFCAGADLSSGGDTFGTDNTFAQAAAAEARVSPWKMKTPTIAALNGAAVGIGATLPLHWDIRLASERAKIGFVFTRRGLVPEANSTWILPRLIGFAKASELMLTGRIVLAQEALEMGLVSEVLPPEDLLPRAREIAQDIAQNTAPVAVSLTRRLLWRQWMEPDPAAAKSREDALFYWIGKHPDVTEGVESFLEKRAPQWQGKASDDGLPAELQASLEPPT